MTRIKRNLTSEIDALILSAITNETWRALTEKTQFPDEARQEIDQAIYFYQASASAIDGANSPAETRLWLKVLAKKVQETREQLTRASENPLAKVVLSKAIVDQQALPAPSDLQLQDWLELQLSNLTRLEGTLRLANTKILSSKPGAFGSSLRNAFLVKSLVDIWEKYSGAEISRSTKGSFNSRDFLLRICEIADPAIGPGSIEDVMKKILHQRGRNRKKTHT